MQVVRLLKYNFWVYDTYQYLIENMQKFHQLLQKMFLFILWAFYVLIISVHALLQPSILGRKVHAQNQQ